MYAYLESLVTLSERVAGYRRISTGGTRAGILIRSRAVVGSSLRDHATHPAFCIVPPTPVCHGRRSD